MLKDKKKEQMSCQGFGVQDSRDVIWNKMGANLKFYLTPNHFILYYVP